MLLSDEVGRVLLVERYWLIEGFALFSGTFHGFAFVVSVTVVNHEVKIDEVQTKV